MPWWRAAHLIRRIESGIRAAGKAGRVETFLPRETPVRWVSKLRNVKAERDENLIRRHSGTGFSTNSVAEVEIGLTCC